MNKRSYEYNFSIFTQQLRKHKVYSRTFQKKKKTNRFPKISQKLKLKLKIVRFLHEITESNEDSLDLDLDRFREPRNFLNSSINKDQPMLTSLLTARWGDGGGAGMSRFIFADRDNGDTCAWFPPLCIHVPVTLSGREINFVSPRWKFRKARRVRRTIRFIKETLLSLSLQSVFFTDIPLPRRFAEKARAEDELSQLTNYARSNFSFVDENESVRFSR